MAAGTGTSSHAESPLVKLLGAELVTSAGTKVKTADRLAGKTTVGLYFSAHWCPPCKMFTPMLASWYKSHAKAKDAEVIFISSDRDESSFKHYLAEMPWDLSTGYNSPAGQRLGGLFKVQGIPTLVTLDVATGEVISKDARSGVMSKPEAWPFRPPTLGDVLASASFETSSGSETLADVRKRADYLFFYFSAHWCGPCRSFTPRFSEWYATKKATMPEGKRFEVAFVSADRDAHSFAEYFGTMPWAAVKYDQRQIAEELNSFFEVEGIPTLTLVDLKTMKTVTTDARTLVIESPEEFPWPPKPVESMSGALGSINDTKTAILFVDKATSPTTAAEAEFEKAATKYFGGDTEMKFCVATSDHPATDQLRGFFGIKGDKDSDDSVRLVVTDIPSGVKYMLGSSLKAMSTAGSVTKLIDSIFDGTATPSGIRG